MVSWDASAGAVKSIAFDEDIYRSYYMDDIDLPRGYYEGRLEDAEDFCDQYMINLIPEEVDEDQP